VGAGWFVGGDDGGGLGFLHRDCAAGMASIWGDLPLEESHWAACCDEGEDLWDLPPLAPPYGSWLTPLTAHCLDADA